MLAPVNYNNNDARYYLFLSLLLENLFYFIIIIVWFVLWNKQTCENLKTCELLKGLWPHHVQTLVPI